MERGLLYSESESPTENSWAFYQGFFSSGEVTASLIPGLIYPCTERKSYGMIGIEGILKIT